MPEPDAAAHPPIERCLERWMGVFHGDADAVAATLDAVLHPDVVLHSPVLFKPQPGKELVTMYLTAAAGTFAQKGPAASAGGSDAGAPASATTPDGTPWDGRFRYVRTLTGDHDAVLEFETTIGGKYVNGVDMITCDDQGLIVDFKVMVRPFQALEAVRDQMLAAITRLTAAD
jgi:hypothetical protein